MQQFKLHDSEKIFLDMLNQLFEIEKKLERIEESNSINRNLSKLKELFETELYQKNSCGLAYYNPIGEPYSETRTDCDASIAGESTDNLVIIEVIKPIIRYRQGGFNHIVQKAIVVVQSQNS
jgi:hypothetical protein